MKNCLRNLIAMAMLVSTLVASADYPAGYYASIDGMKKEELKTALYNIVKNIYISVVGDSQSDPYNYYYYNMLPGFFQRTDVYPPGHERYGQWWDMYSNIPIEVPKFSGVLQREHSFPKSWWKTLMNITAYVDLNHLYPAEATANGKKNNYPLGVVAAYVTPSFDNGCVKVGPPATGLGGGAKEVFEPADEYKGDFARTYFYMVTCYQNLTWNTGYMWMLEQDLWPTLKPWAYEMLLDWHRKDPVSQKEIDRNEQVFQIQNNRNPFIDIPELAEYIWGTKQNEVFRLDNANSNNGQPELITPVKDMALDFGLLAEGKTATNSLMFRGVNINGDVIVQLYRGDTDMFTIDASALTPSQINSVDGAPLKVTYHPTSIGSHSARLLVSGSGVSGSFGVDLIGSCGDTPTLSAVTALPASDITTDSYRANWTPTSDVVDYWIVNRTMYAGGDIMFDEIAAEEPGWIIEGFDQSDSESYTVQSVRLGFKSPESNVIQVSHAGVTGVTVDQPLIVRGYDGCIRFICSDTMTGAKIYDISGKLVMAIDRVTPYLDVEINAGIYFVTTDQCARPVKVIVGR